MCRVALWFSDHHRHRLRQQRGLCAMNISWYNVVSWTLYRERETSTVEDLTRWNMTLDRTTTFTLQHLNTDWVTSVQTTTTNRCHDDQAELVPHPASSANSSLPHHLYHEMLMFTWPLFHDVCKMNRNNTETLCMSPSTSSRQVPCEQFHCTASWDKTSPDYVNVPHYC